LNRTFAKLQVLTDKLRAGITDRNPVTEVTDVMTGSDDPVAHDKTRMAGLSQESYLQCPLK
jgi:hypothetical protein